MIQNSSCLGSGRHGHKIGRTMTVNISNCQCSGYHRGICFISACYGTSVNSLVNKRWPCRDQ